LREILEFAYQFAREFISAKESDEDNITVIAPESAGSSGSAPVFRLFEQQGEESAILQDSRLSNVVYKTYYLTISYERYSLSCIKEFIHISDLGLNKPRIPKLENK
jgi:hypothetical protein